MQSWLAAADVPIAVASTLGSPVRLLATGDGAWGAGRRRELIILGEEVDDGA